MGATSRVVMIEAKPEPVRVDLARCAVIVVDMQNDFGAKGGMFDRAGIDTAPIKQAVANAARVITTARSAGVTIVYLKHEHRPDLADTGEKNAPHWIKHRPFSVGKTVTAPDGRTARICVDNTWNTEIVPELAPQDGDVIVSKHRYSGFFETDLDTNYSGTRREIPHRDWMHDKRVCGVDDPGRHVS